MNITGCKTPWIYSKGKNINTERGQGISQVIENLTGYTISAYKKFQLKFL